MLLYTATINPVLQAKVTVSIAAGVAVDVGGNVNTASNTYSRDAGSPAAAFEEKKTEIEKVVSEEVMRSVTAAYQETQIDECCHGAFR